MQSFVRFLVGLPMGAIYGWAGSLLWQWFVVPFGAQPITLWHAWGLFLTLSLIRVWMVGTNDIQRQKLENEDAVAWGFLILKPVAVLIIVGIGSLLRMGVA